VADGYLATVDVGNKFQDELRGGAVVVATGGLAPVIAPVASTLEHVEPHLTLYGLRIVHARNTER
jgi:type III pantothenate kinase